jgi:hypothetical protein
MTDPNRIVIVAGRYEEVARNLAAAGADSRGSTYLPVELQVVTNWVKSAEAPKYRLQGGEAKTVTRTLNLAHVLSVEPAQVR